MTPRTIYHVDATPSADQPIIEVNRVPDLSHAQLFLDDANIEECTFVSRQWHQPRKLVDAVLGPEHAWERWATAIYGTVLHWRGSFHMWYNVFTADPRPRICYAKSTDGVAWEKPKLGVCELLGDTANNIVLQSVAPRYIDDISVIDDADDHEWPLKALFWEGPGHDFTRHDWGIFAARSKDGIVWDRSPGLVLPQWIDRFNAVSSKVDGKYVVYGRAPDLRLSMARNGRSVWRIESADLLHWSEPTLVLERDAEDPVDMEYYSASVFPYAGLTLGALERMYMSPDRLDTELIWSHDGGRAWQRARTRPALLSPSPPRRWDDTWVNLPTNAPIKHRGRLWLYYTGRSGAHDKTFPMAQSSIGLALLRIDGFASLYSAQREGRVVTKPMVWPADSELYVNIDPRRDLSSHPGFCTGEARIEVLDAENRPVAGLTRDDCEPVAQTLNEPDASRRVVWRGGAIHDLVGKTVKLAFHLRDAHLFSFSVRPRATGS